MEAKPHILVTGTTGNIGSELVKQLSKRDVPFRAMVRFLDKAQSITALQAVQVVDGNFNNSASLQRALEGIEKRSY